jgi:hypothetical protein
MANAFDVLMKDYRTAKADAAARARRVGPVPGYMYPVGRPVLKWPRCVVCHRFAPYAALDANIPSDQRGLFKVTEGNVYNECGEHCVVDDYGHHGDLVTRGYLRWMRKEYPMRVRAYQAAYIPGVMKSRVTAALCLKQKGIPNGPLMAHIIALAETF